jgi:alanine racemase
LKSWVEISRERLVGNFSAVRDVVGDAVEVLAVIKADAYGHGATVCAPVLVDAGARWLGVSDVDEGAIVRDVVGDTARLMVMCGMEVGDAARIVALGLTPVVWTVEQVAALETAARDAGVRVRVHVEVETGMARQGAAVGVELESVLRVLAASEWVRCEGVMTHLCCSEVAGARTTRVAMELFEKALEQVASAGVTPEFVHVGNTSAVDVGETMEWVRAKAEVLGARAMVRTGFAMYGHCLPVEGDDAGVLVERVLPVMTWKTRVTGVREIESGTTVGYGASFVATEKMRLALLPVGYADGFRRAASSGIGDGWVMVGGVRAMVVGRVSMNLTVVDVTGRDVRVGDEVVLLGEGVSAEDHARWAGTIAYDVLCGVKAKVVVV